MIKKLLLRERGPKYRKMQNNLRNTKIRSHHQNTENTEPVTPLLMRGRTDKELRMNLLSQKLIEKKISYSETSKKCMEYTARVKVVKDAFK